MLLPLKRTCSVSRLKRRPSQTGQVTQTSARKSMFQPIGAVALAGLAAAAGLVEAEPARLVAAHLGLGHLGEQASGSRRTP